ncbi:Mg-dependent DNase [Tilletiaria anomala UBC 951]|uniref:Mg-dependent DNase n=1 Tax=Tilletiaria anomala (strain ATCC 24038 / CBS 436.72 / UBC 951) TaxID=1037660 RepID=A0A066WMX7_TILAU|nr:Mg-dependent DNase [Tilletiaria anomala UBC 951]KDN52329.1 Mg-dependent DNase [Tilletiaria anomala UBC 951]
MTPPSAPRFVDIGSNLLDGMFSGHYNGKQAHEADLRHVLTRARAAGVEAQMVTSGSLKESKEAIAMSDSEEDLFCTVGCHPTRVSEIEAFTEGSEKYIQGLKELIDQHRYERSAESSKRKGTVVAIGECGLDYDRLHFAPADLQRKYFDRQLKLAEDCRLPLFLHSRNAHDDLVSILRPRMQALKHAIGGGRVGVVHSFDGSLKEMEELVEMGLYIGLNGCSLKTESNLAVAAQVPLERLMLETDAPWCEPRPSHASQVHLDAFKKTAGARADAYFPAQVKKERWSAESPTAVKGRNEPCAIGGIAAVVAAVQGKSWEEVAHHARENTRRVFGI